MFFFFRVNVYLHVNIVALVILHQTSRCSCLDASSQVAIEALIFSRRDVPVSTHLLHVVIKALIFPRQDVLVSTYFIIIHQMSRCSCLDISSHIAIKSLIILRQNVLVSTYLIIIHQMSRCSCLDISF